MEFFWFWVILALIGCGYAWSRFNEIGERLDRLEDLGSTVAALQRRLAELERQGVLLARGGAEPGVLRRDLPPEERSATVGPHRPAEMPVLSDFVLPKVEPGVIAAAVPLVAPAVETVPMRGPAVPETKPMRLGVPVSTAGAVDGGDRPAGPSWEERIGGQWLTWLGAVTAVIAVGLGLKLAFDQGYLAWILELPPLVYLMLGWVLGGGFLAASLRLKAAMPAYAQGLAGGGIAILYLTTYAGHQLYGVLSAGAATVGLVVVGATAIGLALSHNSVVIGWIGIILAYVSPVLLGGDGSSPAPLFLYLTGLNAAVLGISVRGQWFRFRLAGFLATALLFGLWFVRSYSVLHFSAVLAFVASNSLLFVAALMLPTLLRRERGGEADLTVAVLNPLLTEFALHAILRNHAPEWQGAAAFGFAAVYWAAARLLRARLELDEGEVDYLEQVYFSTALVLMLLAVPLQLKGRAMTAAWALVGAGLTWVGYRTAAGSLIWSRARWWGATALALSVGRLLVVDAWRSPGSGVLLMANERGFSFAVVMLCLAVPAALAAAEWKASERKAGVPEAVLTLLALGLAGLMDLWMGLELSPSWAPAGWSAVAALVLAFGWQVRSVPVRIVGNLVALPPLAMALLEPLAPAMTGSPVSPLPGWSAALLLAVGVSAAYLRAGDPTGKMLSPVYAGAAVALLMIRAAADLPAEWVHVGWSAVAAGAFYLGVRASSDHHRLVGLLAAVITVAVRLGRTWFTSGLQGLPDAGLGAVFLLGLGLAWAFARGDWLTPAERQLGLPISAAVAAMVAMTWSTTAMEPGWTPVIWLGVVLALLATGVRTDRRDVRALGFAVAALLMAEVGFREWELVGGHLLLLHSRTVAAWSAVAAWVACAGVLRKWGTAEERLPVIGAIVLANAVALAWCCTEAMDAASRMSPSGWAREAAQFALSAAWALYAGGLIVTGLRRDLPGARWGGIGLILLAVLKMYLFDLSFLALGYRVLAFLVMAVVLLGVSYLYQRRAPTPG